MESLRYTKIPINKVNGSPEKSGFYHLIRESYWAVSDDDCILMFNGTSPQCNKHKSIVERIIEQVRSPATKIEYLAEVFLPHNCNDYV